MKWIDAIVKVLQDEGEPLRYDEIASKIIERGYRNQNEVGKTPASTVNSLITTHINTSNENSIFGKVGGGVYYLKSQTPKVPSNIKETKAEKELEKKQTDKALKESLKVEIIKCYGMYWRRDRIEWKNNPKLLGRETESSFDIDFSKQIGIYLLHDAREVIYVGQAIKQSLAQRLFNHTKDRLEGRWDRFSWFGFLGVNEKGLLTEKDVNFSATIHKLADTFEAILVEALEPRQNRKKGNSFDGIEYLQGIDSELAKQKSNQYLLDILMQNMPKK